MNRPSHSNYPRVASKGRLVISAGQPGRKRPDPPSAPDEKPRARAWWQGWPATIVILIVASGGCYVVIGLWWIAKS